MAPEPEADPAEVGEGVLHLLRVDVQLLRELGRELVARLRADLLERSVELGGRDAERRRELLADVAAAVAAVAVAAIAALRVAALQRRADLRGVHAGRRRDVVDDGVEAPAKATAVAVAVGEVLARLVESGLHLRGVDAERLGEVGGEVTANAVAAGLVREDRVQRRGDLVDGLPERGRERLRQLRAPLGGRLLVADGLQGVLESRPADAQLRGQAVEAEPAAAEAGTAADATMGDLGAGAARGTGAGGRGVRARGQRAAVAGLRPERVGAQGEHDPDGEKGGELLRSRVHGGRGCPATLRVA